MLAQAYDTPIPGFGTKTMGNLRLWEALPSGGELDLAAFNEGRFVDARRGAPRPRRSRRCSTRTTPPRKGKELRLKQQYFFVSASLQDVLSRHAAGELLEDFSVFEREREKMILGREKKKPRLSTSSTQKVTLFLFPSLPPLSLPPPPSLSLSRARAPLALSLSLHLSLSLSLHSLSFSSHCTPQHKNKKNSGQELGLAARGRHLPDERHAPDLRRLGADAPADRRAGLSWDEAWGITTRCLAFTNHTVMPEALEKWPVARLQEAAAEELRDRRARRRRLARVDQAAGRGGRQGFPEGQPASPASSGAEEEGREESESCRCCFFRRALPLPRPLRLRRLAEAGPAVDPVWAATEDALDRYGILCENPWAPGVKLINMAHLAIVGSSAVNGVAAIHSQILKDDLFKDFYALQPDKFQNKTNGVTPRRWLAFCNPGEAALITEALGSDAWIKDASKLSGLKPFADDAAFRKRWAAVKLENKARLATKVKELTGVDMPLTSMFDVQIKRIHEYKRQLMNVLSRDRAVPGDQGDARRGAQGE